MAKTCYLTTLKFDDGSLLVTTTNPSEMFIHAFIGVHGIHGLKINTNVR